MDIFTELSLPFVETAIDWRISQVFKGENPKAKCLAYIDGRAVMSRLDAVLGIDCWQSKSIPFNGGFMCELSIFVDGKWIVKTDGSDPTDFEGVKGGISGALKRAAVQVGIGRYLYNLDEGWAKISASGSRYQSGGKDGASFKWDAPDLPEWAKWPKALKPQGNLTQFLLAWESQPTQRDKLASGALERFWFTEERRILASIGVEV